MLLRFGAEAEVLAPDELRERITDIVTALAATYPSAAAKPTTTYANPTAT